MKGITAQMKRIGLIGGLGPEATVDYYKEITGAFKGTGNGLVSPEILIYSVNMSEFLEMMNKKEYDKAVNYLLQKINALVAAGADFVALTANTPHLFFNRLRERTGIPLLSIVEATCREAMSRGLKRPGLFGTGFTMNNLFYPDTFSRFGMEVIMPEQEDKEIINHKLFSEIELGIFKDNTRDLLVEIIGKMVKEKGIDSIILGCTEFPLILTETAYAGIPALDTTRIHVKEIVSWCLK